ncbi:hypothetical protein DYH09_07000 [bacterium CPR1]|nr:hypothetical protein [bacterium CPR1]
MAVLLVPLCFLAVMTLISNVLHDNRFALDSRTDAELFYMAEAGIAIAENAFARSNFTGFTHLEDGHRAPEVNPLGIAAEVATQRTQDFGYYSMVWAPGHDPAESFGLPQRPQKIHFKVQRVHEETYLIESTAHIGRRHLTHRVYSVLEPAFSYVSFADGQDDFDGVVDATVQGKIHANGDLSLRPAGGRLDILGSVFSAGRILRSDGAAAGSVYINGVEMPGGGAGTAFDSRHPLWDDPGPGGAVARFGSSLLDAQLGAPFLVPPPIQSLEPGGFYEQKADLVIEASTAAAWCSDRTFFNRGEGRSVAVKEIDVSALAFPNAGLSIYSHVPVRLINASPLPAPLTVASQCSIYVRGDFNCPPQPRGAGLLTTDRVWFLSSSFADPPANTGPAMAFDSDDRLEIHAGIVQGSRPGDGSVAMLSLENMRELDLAVYGSMVGLQNARMAADWEHNSDAVPGISAWVVGGSRTVDGVNLAPVAAFSPYYVPPASRRLEYEPSVLLAPLMPRVSRRLEWRQE